MIVAVLWPSVGDAGTPIDTTVCDIARHPTRWAGKLVRIHAGIHTVCIEGGYALFDVRCPREWVSFDTPEDPNDPSRRTSDAALAKLDNARCKVASSPNRMRHAEATLEGRLSYDRADHESTLVLIDAFDVEVVPGIDPTRWSPGKKRER